MSSTLGPSIDWEEEGRQLAGELDNVSAAVVVGRDPVAAAKVALGIGRVQARRRRVAIGDLVGEISALQALVPAGEGHGLVDSFLYGVSLTKIAHPIDPAKNLYVLPSGMEPIDYDTILRSDRWAKLTSGFREVEALLLVLVPARASGLDALVESVDGAIVVGDERRSVPGRVLATVRPAAMGVGVLEEPSVDDTALAAAFEPGGIKRRTWLVAAVVLVVLALIAALVFWPRADSSAGAIDPAIEAPQEGAAVASTPAPMAAEPAARETAPVAPFAVELFRVSSITDANAHVDGRTEDGLPAVTYVPVIRESDGARIYALVTGAFQERAAAESLLTSLREREVVAANRGSILRAPFALLIQRGVSAENAPGLANAYHVRGLPVYALLQPDGSATLYAGAFADSADAEALAAPFRAAGEQPTIAQRTGRIF